MNRKQEPQAEINMAKIPVSGDFVGLLFAAATAMIFYWGIPAVRFLVPGTIMLGCAIALVLRFVHHETELPHIFTGSKK
jgi:hypothetical protein